jgi:hypothetical protein
MSVGYLGNFHVYFRQKRKFYNNSFRLYSCLFTSIPKWARVKKKKRNNDTEYKHKEIYIIWITTAATATVSNGGGGGGSSSSSSSSSSSFTEVIIFVFFVRESKNWNNWIILIFPVAEFLLREPCSFHSCVQEIKPRGNTRKHYSYPMATVGADQ